MGKFVPFPAVYYCDVGWECWFPFRLSSSGTYNVGRRVGVFVPSPAVSGCNLANVTLIYFALQRHAMRQLGGIWVLIHYRAIGIKLS